MTNALDIFSAAMGLIDEVNETTGATDTPDTREYKNRTLLILNVLRGELYPYSDTFQAAAPGKRPICGIIPDFETAIGLDDYICQSVMPYGLAAHLLLDENPSAASYFQQRYDELKNRLAQGFPQTAEDITDIYGELGGISPYNEFSQWG